jgi:hypothetical protein
MLRYSTQHEQHAQPTPGGTGMMGKTMTYAITLNGYYYKGQNHNGPVYGTSVSEAKHFYSRQYAV